MEDMATLVQLLKQDKGGERNLRSGNIIGNIERPGKRDREERGRRQVGERIDAENEVSGQAFWQMMEQGREGTTLERMRVVTI